MLKADGIEVRMDSMEASIYGPAVLDLLTEAKQRVPPFLATLASEQEALLKVGGDPGCSYCGGLGHRITACPKLESMNHKKSAAAGGKDYLASNADDY